jgi:hypothetical protein
MPTRRLTINAGLAALLAERGGQTAAELGAQLADLGLTKARNVEAVARNNLEHDDRFLAGPGGRWWPLAERLEGAVFTVRLTALERHHEFVLLRPDLALVAKLLPRALWHRDPVGPRTTTLGDVLDPSRRIAQVRYHLFDDTFDDDPGDLFDHDGFPKRPRPRPAPDPRELLGDGLVDDVLSFATEIGEDRATDEAALWHVIDDLWDEPVLHGPPGWLPELRPRDALVIRVRGGGLDLAAASRVAADAARETEMVTLAGEVARSVLDEAGGGRSSVPLSEVLERLAIVGPDAFAPGLPPVSRLLHRAGLKVEGGRVGHPGPARRELRWLVDPDPDAPWGFAPGDRVA